MTNVESILNIVEELKNMFAINEFDFLLYLLLILLWIWLYNQIKKRDLFIEAFQLEKGSQFIKDLYILEQLLKNWEYDNNAIEKYQEASSNIAAIVSPSLLEKVKAINGNSSKEEIESLDMKIAKCSAL